MTTETLEKKPILGNIFKLSLDNNSIFHFNNSIVYYNKCFYYLIFEKNYQEITNFKKNLLKIFHLKKINDNQQDYEKTFVDNILDIEGFYYRIPEKPITNSLLFKTWKEFVEIGTFTSLGVVVSLNNTIVIRNNTEFIKYPTEEFAKLIEFNRIEIFHTLLIPIRGNGSDILYPLVQNLHFVNNITHLIEPLEPINF
jgi:hypothetical protein